MKLSKRSEYALRALIDLGVAAELGRPIVRVRELADKEKLPVKFLEQILIQLKAAGYISTTRGKFGGYSLAMPADRIGFGNVMRLVEGPLAPIPCVSLSAYAPCSCPDEAHCGLRMLMLDLRNAIARVLDRYTLEEIVSITLRKLRRDGLTSPFLAPARSESTAPSNLLPLKAIDGVFEPHAASPRNYKARRSRGKSGNDSAKGPKSTKRHRKG